MSETDEQTIGEKRDALVEGCVTFWSESDDSSVRKIWEIVRRAMEFVGSYDAWSGSDKKAEVLLILELWLDETDQPGPDFVVDPAILWVVEGGIDYLYDAFKGKFEFDG